MPAGGEIRKRSVLIAGHRTSVSLEPEFWAALKDIARARRVSINDLVTEIDRSRRANLSSALRVFVLGDVCARLAAASPHPEPSAGDGEPRA
ncbi:MAG: ribbon-helix-helix domain-containing protein [Pseudomonadota bacterium]